jgi:hypothetical protein
MPGAPDPGRGAGRREAATLGRWARGRRRREAGTLGRWAWPGAQGRRGAGAPGRRGAGAPGLTVGPISLDGKRSGTANLSVAWFKLIMKVGLALNKMKLGFHHVLAW